jgi:hypothetical protein
MRGGPELIRAPAVHRYSQLIANSKKPLGQR